MSLIYFLKKKNDRCINIHQDALLSTLLAFNQSLALFCFCQWSPFSNLCLDLMKKDCEHTLAFSSRHLTKVEFRYCLRWLFSSCSLASSSSFCIRVSWSCKKQTMVKATPLCWLSKFIVMLLLLNPLKHHYSVCFPNRISGSPLSQRPKLNLHPSTTWLFSFVLWIFHWLQSVWGD